MRLIPLCPTFGSAVVWALLLIFLGYGCPWRDRHTCERRDTPIKLTRGRILENGRVLGFESWSLEVTVLHGDVRNPGDPLWSLLIQRSTINWNGSCVSAKSRSALPAGCFTIPTTSPLVKIGLSTFDCDVARRCWVRHMASFIMGRRTQIRGFHSTTGSRRTKYMMPQVGQGPSPPLHRLQFGAGNRLTIYRRRVCARPHQTGKRRTSPEGDTQQGLHLAFAR